ncbi:MAG: hypothetical protein J6P98_06225, partial [Clostridia bacterium]|nr:hypothetical protein [Clostridia bacterium]
MKDLIWIISSCVLIALVIAVRAIFGKKMSAGLRYALWGLVLIRLLVPGTIFKSPVSVTSAVQEAPVARDLDAISTVSAIAQTESGAVIGQLRRPEAAKPVSGETSMSETAQQTSAQASAHTDTNTKPAPQTAVILGEATPERFESLKKTLEARDILRIIWFTGMGLAA